MKLLALLKFILTTANLIWTHVNFLFNVAVVLRLPNVARRILDRRLKDWVPSTMAKELVSPAPRFLENIVEISILNKIWDDLHSVINLCVYFNYFTYLDESWSNVIAVFAIESRHISNHPLTLYVIGLVSRKWTKVNSLSLLPFFKMLENAVFNKKKKKNAPQINICIIIL